MDIVVAARRPADAGAGDAAAVHRVDAPWRPSTTLETTGWPPGMYLLRLDTDRGAVRRFVPLVVRTASARGAVVMVNANTTWQAYNQWGGYSLYRGPTGGDEDRARAVTFDRPYDYGAGAGDFIGAELPLLAWPNASGCRWPTRPTLTCTATRTCSTEPGP